MTTRTNKRTSSSRKECAVKTIPFEVSQYMGKTLLWLILFWFVSKMVSPYVVVFFFEKGHPHLVDIFDGFRSLFLWLFILVRCLVILRRRFSKLFIYDDKLVYKRPRLGKWQTTIFMKDIEEIFMRENLSLPFLSKDYTLSIYPFEKRGIKLKNLSLGEHVYDLIVDKANL